MSDATETAAATPTSTRVVGLTGEQAAPWGLIVVPQDALAEDDTLKPEVRLTEVKVFLNGRGTTPDEAYENLHKSLRRWSANIGRFGRYENFAVDHDGYSFRAITGVVLGAVNVDQAQLWVDLAISGTFGEPSRELARAQAAQQPQAPAEPESDARHLG